MLDSAHLDLPSLLSLAQNPQTEPTQLVAIVEWLNLQADSEPSLAHDGLDYINTIARQGPLSSIIEPGSSSPILAAIVANPNTPATLALEYAADVPAALFANPALPLWLNATPDLFQAIAPLRQLMLLRYAHIPSQILSMLATSNPEIAQTIQLHVGLNPNIKPTWYEDYQHAKQQIELPDLPSTALLQELSALDAINEPMLNQLRHSSAEQHQALFNQSLNIINQPLIAQTLDFTPSYATLLDTSFAQRMQVAHSNDVKGLAVLAEDDELQIRLIVAQNPATPRTVHQLLELDESQQVRAALARNPNINPNLLLTLARDYSWSAVPIRIAAALNPVATTEILTRLAHDQASIVRQTVLQNPHTTPSIVQYARQRALIEALYSLDPWVHMLAMGHTATPIEQLAKGIKSPWWFGRAALAENASCPTTTLEQLSQDGNGYVQQLAKQQLQQR